MQKSSKRLLLCGRCCGDPLALNKRTAFSQLCPSDHDGLPLRSLPIKLSMSMTGILSRLICLRSTRCLEMIFLFGYLELILRK